MGDGRKTRSMDFCKPGVSGKRDPSCQALQVKLDKN